MPVHSRMPCMPCKLIPLHSSSHSKNVQASAVSKAGISNSGMRCVPDAAAVADPASGYKMFMCGLCSGLLTMCKVDVALLLQASPWCSAMQACGQLPS